MYTVLHTTVGPLNVYKNWTDYEVFVLIEFP